MEQPRTCQEVLAVVREFMTDDSTVLEREQRALWNVLTALRGPDFEDPREIKSVTTAVIRQRVFGPGSSWVRRHVDINPDPEQGPGTRVDPQIEELSWDHHFGYHAQEAFKALGLFWSVRNEP